MELVDEAVPSEHSETLRRFESKAAAAAAAAAAAPEPQEEPVGALELKPWRPWRPCNPCRPVWFVSCSSRRLRNLCSRDSCSLCTACLRSRSSRLCNTTQRPSVFTSCSLFSPFLDYVLVVRVHCNFKYEGIHRYIFVDNSSQCHMVCNTLSAVFFLIPRNDVICLKMRNVCEHIEFQ